MIIMTQSKSVLVDAQTVSVRTRGNTGYILWAEGLYRGSNSNVHQEELAAYGTYAEAKEALKYIAERLNAGDTVVEL